MIFAVLVPLLSLAGALPAMSGFSTKEELPLPSPEPRVLDRFKVMSFNIRYGTAGDRGNSWHFRRELAAEVVQQHLPDIMGLQEALDFQINYMAQSLPEFDHVGVGRDHGDNRGEHAPIFFRHDRFALDSSGTFWFSDTPHQPGSRGWGNRQPRICTWAQLRDRRTGQRLRVYNLHLDHLSRRSREKSMALLQSYLGKLDRSMPVVILGDFNAGEGSSAVRMLLDEGAAQHTIAASHLIDTYRAIHPRKRRVGTMHYYFGLRGGRKIDYIISSTNLHVRHAAILHDRYHDRYPSDHFPVTAELAFARTASSDTATIEAIQAQSSPILAPAF